MIIPTVDGVITNVVGYKNVFREVVGAQMINQIIVGRLDVWI